MVWGYSVGPLVLVEGKLNYFGYIQILKNNLLPWIHKKFNIFSNKIIHSSILPKIQRTGCLRNRLRFSESGPDLNPIVIENLWGELQRRGTKTKFTPHNKCKLYVVLKEWETISRKTYKKLINSMSRHVHECIERCGVWCT